MGSVVFSVQQHGLGDCAVPNSEFLPANAHPPPFAVSRACVGEQMAVRYLCRRRCDAGEFHIAELSGRVFHLLRGFPLVAIG